ncbi:MAG: MarR family transcriptional regulator [Campylobacterales bacterium]|nr:MarR family transcriptional regulator [Campylobacterales bacterium]
MEKRKIEEYFGCAKKNCHEHDSLSVPIMLLSKLLQDHFEVIAKSYGMTSSEVDVLFTVSFHERPISPTELYEGMLFSSGGMTKLLKKLESSDYIERLPNPDDKRSMLVNCTPKGKELSEQVLAVTINDENNLFSCLDDTERSIMEKALEKVIRRIIN